MKILVSPTGHCCRRYSACRDIKYNSRKDSSGGFKEHHPAKHQNHYREIQHCGHHHCAKNGRLVTICCRLPQYSVPSTCLAQVITSCLNKPLQISYKLPVKYILTNLDTFCYFELFAPAYAMQKVTFPNINMFQSRNT